MSLIKIAFNVLAPVQGIFSGLGTVAASSGNPAKYIFKKDKGLLGIRRKLQKVTLSTYSNALKEIKNGKTNDSTRLISAIADTQLGQMMNMGIGASHSLYNANSIGGTITRKVLDKAITPKGKYNIDYIEKTLNNTKNLHDTLNKINKSKLTILAPATIGGTIGGIKASKHDNSDTNKDKFKVSKGVAKGALYGLGIGYGIKRGVNSLANNTILKYAPIAHKHYFEDNYWRKQLEGANRINPIGSFLAKRFTATPKARAARIARFEAISDLGNTNVNESINVFLKKGKKAAKAIYQSFKVNNE